MYVYMIIVPSHCPPVKEKFGKTGAKKPCGKNRTAFS